MPSAPQFVNTGFDLLKKMAHCSIQGQAAFECVKEHLPTPGEMLNALLKWLLPILWDSFKFVLRTANSVYTEVQAFSDEYLDLDYLKSDEQGPDFKIERAKMNDNMAKMRELFATNLSETTNIMLAILAICCARDVGLPHLLPGGEFSRVIDETRAHSGAGPPMERLEKLVVMLAASALACGLRRPVRDGAIVGGVAGC
ncbi:hypothetical protein OPT61_g8173 [Boeremia exigua]|uniref:Uncharacterized protein n=1 Tax=Boeremia exigua TaxID=749465 RepID=A0ACC2I0E8_9PLEO|nr:hypothetical protein OPT61_g8173 [Boeremia exigua]